MHVTLRRFVVADFMAKKMLQAMGQRVTRNTCSSSSASKPIQPQHDAAKRDLFPLPRAAISCRLE
jgi:hypothetical protein